MTEQGKCHFLRHSMTHLEGVVLVKVQNNVESEIKLFGKSQISEENLDAIAEPGSRNKGIRI